MLLLFDAECRVLDAGKTLIMIHGNAVVLTASQVDVAMRKALKPGPTEADLVKKLVTERDRLHRDNPALQKFSINQLVDMELIELTEAERVLFNKGPVEAARALVAQQTNAVQKPIPAVEDRSPHVEVIESPVPATPSKEGFKAYAGLSKAREDVSDYFRPNEAAIKSQVSAWTNGHDHEKYAIESYIANVPLKLLTQYRPLLPQDLLLRAYAHWSTRTSDGPRQGQTSTMPASWSALLGLKPEEAPPTFAGAEGRETGHVRLYEGDGRPEKTLAPLV